MMKNFTYPQATKYLDDCLIFGIKPSLVRINKILDLMGKPQSKVDFIHVVGTNGKTSTAIMIANILYGQGVRSGFHISPHINEYNERMWSCGKEVPRKRFAGLLNDIFPYIERVNSLGLGGKMTQFEILAAMAFELAAREELKVMVLEAGMGGRWDATNAAYSCVAGLTDVSLEHTSILGKTIKEIAMEKVQVVKNEALVATLSKNEKVLSVLKERIRSKNARLFLPGVDFSLIRKEKKYLEGWSVDIKGINGKYLNLDIPLLGDYQPCNFSLALVLSELYLSTLGETINRDKLKKSISKLNVKGRFEIINRKPLVIADASHNPAGIESFVNNVTGNFSDKNIIIIFSVLKDKDYKKMLGRLLTVADKIILTSSNTSRSLGTCELKKEALKTINILKEGNDSVPDGIFEIDTIPNSLKYALKISKSNDIICITGSITNLGKVF